MKEYTVRVYENGSRMWRLNGQRHREDGPAIEWADGTKSWYLNGNWLTEEEHKRRTSGITMDDALAAGDGVILRGQADARLIAAAPDLLEAVQYALDVSAEGLRLGEEWQFRARAAIAKAKGE